MQPHRMPRQSVQSRAPVDPERVAQLLESREQLRELAARLQKAREEDRAAIARELHDELGQTLTAIKLELGRVMAMFAKERLETRTVDRFQSLAGLVEIGLTTVRRIATDLRPPVLDHLGLPSAIRWEAIAFRARTGLKVAVRGVRDETALTADQQIGVFRIFQEALTNVVRHARATTVAVTLTEKSDLFVLRIRDNGRGITRKEQADPRSIGLLGMRERAALLGGELVIGGRTDRGTTVTIGVPLAARRRSSRSARPRRRD